MPQPEFKIVITESSVDVRHDVSSKSPRGRFYAGFFFLALVILGVCALLFSPGKHGYPSMWHDLSMSPIDTSGFIFPVILILMFVTYSAFLIPRYLVAAYPTGEIIHCDRSALTVSRIPWLDVSNSKWASRTYLLNDITQIRFGVIASAKGSSVYGIRFKVGDKKQKILPGLEAPEAAEILKALTALGADVVDDPKLSKKVQEKLSNPSRY